MKQSVPVTADPAAAALNAINGPWKLTFKIISAAILESTDGWMSKMDPYPLIELTRGDKVRVMRGPTNEGGHKAPKWDWPCEITYGGEPKGPLTDEDKIKFAIFEEDTMNSDDFVGETEVMKVAALLASTEPQ